jgi:hypothetical protein
MKSQELNKLIRFINMMINSNEFNFIAGDRIINIKDIHHTHFNNINVYLNEDILYIIDSNEHIYYSFKYNNFKLNNSVSENIDSFLKSITPFRKGLGLKGYKYKNVDDFTCDILQELMS